MYERGLKHQALNEDVSVTDAISYATCTAARALKATAVLVSTSSGYTARMVAKNRPQAPIIAVTARETVGAATAVSVGRIFLC